MCCCTPNLSRSSERSSLVSANYSDILTLSDTHPVILVSRHRHELALGEDEGLEVLRGAGVLAPGVDVDHVQAGLVAVHRVQYHLHRESSVLDVSNGHQS